MVWTCNSCRIPCPYFASTWTGIRFLVFQNYVQLSKPHLSWSLDIGTETVILGCSVCMSKPLDCMACKCQTLHWYQDSSFWVACSSRSVLIFRPLIHSFGFWGRILLDPLHFLVWFVSQILGKKKVGFCLGWQIPFCKNTSPVTLSFSCSISIVVITGLEQRPVLECRAQGGGELGERKVFYAVFLFSFPLCPN